MARSDRLERLDAQRADLEVAYRETLVAALQKAAGGALGLLDHHSDRRVRAAIAPTIAELTALGDDIDTMRARLVLEPFTLHRDFLAARGPVAASAVGEAKQARAWLDRLAADA